MILGIEMYAITTVPEIDELISGNAPVAVGVSGGKDSQAAALATFEHLDRVGHTGPRILIHADLGRTEWDDSLPTCERLAEHLSCELVVVRRKAGDMLARWQSRWASSVRRYINLETVTLVLPWSTPSMRFCTSELKTHIIAAELRRRFPGQVVVSVTGVRRQESASRAKQAIATLDAAGKAWSWRPISDWVIEEVFDRIARSGLSAHEAYTSYGLSRVSCRFCIMSSEADLVAATTAHESHPLYHDMVALEVESTFGFQSSRWLADVAPHLLTDDERALVVRAKQRSALRVLLEKAITPGMLYVKGWPTRMLTDEEASTLAYVRTEVSGLMGFSSSYLDVSSIHGRYSDLMAQSAARESRKIELVQLADAA
jgi:3'-phosphoadenosine 5'-phosphosulfate sulfotransferase (PAPS reductase)/FAD synthetase